jgi:D-hexose-6-phosphate mutarotase
MQTPATLNEKFAQPGLTFNEGAGGLVFAEIDNALSSATICLQGAHVVTWKPKSETEPVVWVSDMAKYGPGKSIRGGVPICWPWFGPHATEKGFPGHGFARTVMWQVSASETLADGATRVKFMLLPNEQTHAQFPKACRAELVVTVGASLGVDLVSTNLDTEPVEIGEALHTYFRIGDIADIRIAGLENTAYLDKVGEPTRRTQDGAVDCAGEVDRVYVDTGADCVIDDPRLGRRIRVAKTGSRSTVVWTPWVEKAEKMGDFGPGKTNQGGWREMVCVESGNALENVVTIPPGEAHVMSVRYSVERD